MSTYRRLVGVSAVLALAGLAVAGFALAARVQPGAARGPALQHRVLSRAFQAMAPMAAQTPESFRPPLIATHASANSQVFTDPAGDSGIAPDITTVTVSNDDAGQITIAAAVANRSSLSSDDLILVAIDSDQNPGTGLGGFEYAMGLGPGVSAFLAWNGTTLVPTSAPSFSASFAGGQAVFRINRSDLGNSSGLNLALASSGDAGNSTAEDAGPWNYQVIVGGTATTPAPPTTTTTTTPTPPPPPPPSLGVVAFSVTKPKAGKRFSVQMVVWDATGGIPSGKVACSARIGAKTLRLTSKLDPEIGLSQCSWLVPKNGRGKTVKGTMSVTAEGLTVRRSFAAKVG